MIDWVSIVRNSGQRFSSIIGSGVPLKIRRRRRKRAVAQQQQQPEQILQKFKTPQTTQLPNVKTSKIGGNGTRGAVGSPGSRSSEFWKDNNNAGIIGRVPSEDEDCESCSASISMASSTGNYLSTSPGCSSLPGTSSSGYAGGGISTPGNTVFVTRLPGSLVRRNSLCDVHGSGSGFVVVSSKNVG